MMAAHELVLLVVSFRFLMLSLYSLSWAALSLRAGPWTENCWPDVLV